MGSVGGEDSEQGKVAYASIMMPEEHKKKDDQEEESI